MIFFFKKTLQKGFSDSLVVLVELAVFTATSFITIFLTYALITKQPIEGALFSSFYVIVFLIVIFVGLIVGSLGIGLAGAVCDSVSGKNGEISILLFSTLVYGIWQGTKLLVSNVNVELFVIIVASYTATIITILVGASVTFKSLVFRVPELNLIYSIAAAFSTINGTSYQRADLSNANFTQASLQNTDFRESKLFQTYWLNAKNLKFAYMGSSYLQYSEIRTLVVTSDGRDQDFDDLNLAGINLRDADLESASFIGANLNHANLQCANLSGAVLKQAQLDGADLTGACLTGAYIEDWGITGETKLDGVCCEYVYMHVPTKDDPDPLRKPDNRNEVFADGDFADFIKPIVDTLDLYHNQGVDPRAIAIAFKNLAEDNPAAELEIVAMEKRGRDKVLLRAKTAPGIDKSELSRAYFEDYNQLKALLANHPLRLLLDEKDDRIRSLENMVETALKQPKFYTENYHHRGDVMPENSGVNINAGGNIGDINGLVGGDVSGVVNLGEVSGQVTNTINQLPASPQPDEPGIKELLEQLHRAIESAEELKPEDKAEALKQVQALAEAGKDPAEPEKQNGAKSAIRWLKGMLTELAEPSAIVQLCKHVLPQIAGIFGL
ncbi:pentapeptide repeat-containing protein [Trichocoleus sp. FACHB-262]|nr:pentapeptide repeat-containing protein [Trichocoleus sp. FACHB-262]